MASTSVSNPSCIIQVLEEYPYPSHNFAVNIVTVKLSGKDMYNVWEEQMLCLLTSHDMLGFIDGRFLSPFDGNGKAKEEVMKAWSRSDSLVKGWILGSLSERAASRVVNRLISKHENAYFSAKDAWDELKCMYGPSQQTEITEVLNPSCKIDVGEDEYPYPSHNFANTNIVTVKLSGKDVYNVWKKQMLCLLTSHDMLGFIDGGFLSPSDGNGEAKEEDMKAWIRSDSLVKGWILGSLSEKTAVRVVHRLTSKHKTVDFSAKDAWYELKCIFDPSVPQQTEDNSISEDAKSVDEGKIHHERRETHYRLYGLLLQGKSEKAFDKLRELGLTPMDKITSDGNTSLHVVVGSSTKNQEFLEKLLEFVPRESLNVQNSDGSTPLHVAAIVGNTEAADVLARKNPNLLFAKDKKGHMPLYISLFNRHNKTSQCLLDHIRNYEGSHTIDSSGAELLIHTIFHKKISFALELVRLYDTIPHSEAVLMAIAQNFPSELSFLERIDTEDIYYGYYAWKYKHRRLIRSCGPSVAVIWKFLIFGILMIHMVSVTIIKKIVRPFIKERMPTHEDAILLLWEVFDRIQMKSDSSSVPQYYTNLIFGATRLNAFEVVAEILSRYPEAISSINEDGLNFIQYAVINRSEKIYNLLYKHYMIDHKNIDKTITDLDGNNLLHLAGRLAPADKLYLISGAALQIQRELQWFKEVEEFVGPIIRVQTNYDDETPEMVFNREHKDLVNEGEKWMKATSKSYTITAALIITIVFAAAITVPGGNNQITGIPIHNNNIAFKMFAVSNAISLFTAVTSLLMFLSILTTRFSAEDFLRKLPKRLIIGLAALFISTTAMIIAFGASLFLVFGHDNSWILIPIGVLTCLPITSFVTLQFPLIWDLTTATYYGHRFDKRKLIVLY